MGKHPGYGYMNGPTELNGDFKMYVLTIDGTSLTDLRQQLLELTAALVTSPITNQPDIALKKTLDELEAEDRASKAQNMPADEEIGGATSPDSDAMDEARAAAPAPKKSHKKKKNPTEAARAKTVTEAQLDKLTGRAKAAKEVIPGPKVTDVEIEVGVEAVDPNNVEFLTQIKAKVSARYGEAKVRDATKSLLATYGVTNFNLVPLQHMGKLAFEVDQMLDSIPAGA